MELSPTHGGALTFGSRNALLGREEKAVVNEALRRWRRGNTPNPRPLKGILKASPKCMSMAEVKAESQHKRLGGVTDASTPPLTPPKPMPCQDDAENPQASAEEKRTAWVLGLMMADDSIILRKAQWWKQNKPQGLAPELVDCLAPCASESFPPETRKSTRHERSIDAGRHGTSCHTPVRLRCNYPWSSQKREGSSTQKRWDRMLRWVRVLRDQLKSREWWRGSVGGGSGFA
ncbi:unnamed protein product [Chrysoparadoxa australica]